MKNYKINDRARSKKPSNLRLFKRKVDPIEKNVDNQNLYFFLYGATTKRPEI